MEQSSYASLSTMIACLGRLCRGSWSICAMRVRVSTRFSHSSSSSGRRPVLFVLGRLKAAHGRATICSTSALGGCDGCHGDNPQASGDSSEVCMVASPYQRYLIEYIRRYTTLFSLCEPMSNTPPFGFWSRLPQRTNVLQHRCIDAERRYKSQMFEAEIRTLRRAGIYYIPRKKSTTKVTSIL